VYTFSEFEYHIRVDDDVYELSREASSIASTNPFNIIFMRYFKQDTPQTTLAVNSSVLTGVGIGFIDSSPPDQLQYDFSEGWNIQLLAKDVEEHVVGSKTVIISEWEEKEFVFS
jgi:hypothetical protein